MAHWYTIKSPDQIDAITSPGREDIIDTVGQIGPCSISQLARALGRPRNGLYYGVRALRDCGLLIENHQSVAGAKTTAVYDVAARPMTVNFSVDTQQQRAAVNRLAEARLKQAIKGVRRASAANDLVTAGPARNFQTTRVKGWLSEADIVEVNQLLEQIVNKLSRRGTAGDRAFDLTFALYPTSPKPKGRRGEFS